MNQPTIEIVRHPSHPGAAGVRMLDAAVAFMPNSYELLRGYADTGGIVEKEIPGVEQMTHATARILSGLPLIGAPELGSGFSKTRLNELGGALLIGARQRTLEVRHGFPAWIPETMETATEGVTKYGEQTGLMALLLGMRALRVVRRPEKVHPVLRSPTVHRLAIGVSTEDIATADGATDSSVARRVQQYYEQLAGGGSYGKMRPGMVLAGYCAIALSPNLPAVGVAQAPIRKAS